jgi:hypothetical protein
VHGDRQIGCLVEKVCDVARAAISLFDEQREFRAGYGVLGDLRQVGVVIPGFHHGGDERTFSEVQLLGAARTVVGVVTDPRMVWLQTEFVFGSIGVDVVVGAELGLGHAPRLKTAGSRRGGERG